jgi:hypothetical protein
MRRFGTPSVGRILATWLAASLLAPTLVCGAGSATLRETSECCRAMRFTCHNRHSATCCEQKDTAPASFAVLTMCRSTAKSQLTIIALLPALAIPTLLDRSFYTKFALSGEHSPPSDVPLFLRNSVLLI